MNQVSVCVRYDTHVQMYTYTADRRPAHDLPAYIGEPATRRSQSKTRACDNRAMSLLSGLHLAVTPIQSKYGL